MKRINIARMIRDARTKYYWYHRDYERYGHGAGRDLALDDQLAEIWAEMAPGDRIPDLEAITGNEWEDSDREEYDSRIAIGGGWYRYTNNGGSAVMRALH